MPGRLLVTGAGGFVGRYVQAACAPGGAFGGWEFVGSPKGLDIRNADEVADWVAASRADRVLHLAAQSFVPRSFEAPAETLDINIKGTLILLQALKATGFAGRFLFVSSGDIYGQVPEERLPVDESLWPRPRSPYAVSKFAAEQLCLQWTRTEGLDAIIARPFNHVGPGQDRRFVLPALAAQVVASGRGGSAIIEVGDIDATRDFTDVRDVVDAYAAIFERGTAGATYLVASGRERSVRELLALMCAQEGVQPEIRQDAARMRPAEQRRMVADPGRLCRHTGWQPRIPIETTLKDILTDARGEQ